ncbi:hypothetical protein GQ42DRAFT_177626 [Ramicandelaber brevisporus]|nr:hypothetical protein GQ42DRAFT_177626 [Ramicandelaber brevisporus]
MNFDSNSNQTTTRQQQQHKNNNRTPTTQQQHTAAAMSSEKSQYVMVETDAPAIPPPAPAPAPAAEQPQPQPQPTSTTHHLPHGFEFASVRPATPPQPQTPILPCARCNAAVPATIHHKIGYTSLAASGAAMMICGPLFWVPLLVSSIRDDVYQCACCKKEIGRVAGYKKFLDA